MNRKKKVFKKKYNIMLTEEFKRKYERMAAEDGHFAPFDWEAVEKEVEEMRDDEEDDETEIEKSTHPKKIINYKKKNYGNEQN